MKLAGIQLRPESRAEAMAHFLRILQTGQGSMVVTVNPEMIVHATRDPLFKTIIHSAEMHLIDGAGIAFAGRMRGYEKPDRFTGVEAVHRVAELSAELGSRVFLLGTRDSLTLMQAARNLQKKYPALQIVGTYADFTLKEEKGGVTMREEDERAIVSRIVETRADVVLVALGHGKQEKWIWQYKKMLPNVKLFMGVGGALDFIAGNVRRAPAWMQRAGLEWLWRVVREPSRAPRIFNATIVFLWKTIRN